MLIKPPSDIRSSEITDKKLYLNRREFIRAAAGTAAVAAAGVARRRERSCSGAAPRRTGASSRTSEEPAQHDRREAEHLGAHHHLQQLLRVRHRQGRAGASTRKRSRPQPWTVEVEGECAKPAAMHLEDILKGQTLEERIYRHRCVEAWSMVIPWVGFPLADFIKRVRADVEGEVRRVHDAVRPDADARPAAAACCAGRTSKGCAWTRRCTR